MIMFSFILAGLIVAIAFVAALITECIKQRTSVFDSTVISKVLILLVFIFLYIFTFCKFKQKYDTRVITNFQDGKYELIEKSINGNITNSYYKLK